MRFLKRWSIISFYFLAIPLVIGVLFRYGLRDKLEVQAIPNHLFSAEIADRRARLLGEPVQPLFETSSQGIVRWLASHQTESGQMDAAFNVRSDQSTLAWNPFYGAKALYSLAAYLTEKEDQAGAEALEKGLAFFESISLDQVVDGKELHYYEANNSVQSNLTAMILLVKLERLEATQVEDPFLTQMADYVLASQLEEGSFNAYYLNRMAIQCNVSDNYQGVALFALVRAGEVLGDSRYLDAAKRAADFAIQNYDPVNPEFSMLGIDGLSQLYEQSKDEGIRAYLLEQAGKLLDSVYGPMGYFLSGEDNRPPLETPWYYNEGMVSLYKALSNNEQDAELVSKIEVAVVRSLSLSAAFQFPDPTLLPVAPASNAYGGACTNTYCETQSLDASAALLKAYVAAVRIFPATTLEMSVGSFDKK